MIHAIKAHPQLPTPNSRIYTLPLVICPRYAKEKTYETCPSCVPRACSNPGVGHQLHASPITVQAAVSSKPIHAPTQISFGCKEASEPTFR